MLLNAAKDVASALGALINATKNASGKSVNDPSMEELKTTGKVSICFELGGFYFNSVGLKLTLYLFQTMVANVSSLLKTVKSVEDKALRGTRALESTVDAVKQAVLVN